MYGCVPARGNELEPEFFWAVLIEKLQAAMTKTKYTERKSCGPSFQVKPYQPNIGLIYS